MALHPYRISTKTLLTFGTAAVALALLFHLAIKRVPQPLTPEPPRAARAQASLPPAQAWVPAAPRPFSLAACIAALHSSDPVEIQAAFQELMAYLAQHPDESSAILASLKLEADYPRFIAWLAQLATDKATSAPPVFKRWAIELAQTDPSLPAQQTALALLDHASPEADLLPVLSKVYHDATDPQLQVTALMTLKNWSEKNQDATLQARLRQSLVEMINSSSDEEVRTRGLEALARVGLPDATLLEAADLLWQEPAEANRSLLARAFDQGGESAREFAVARLEQVYTQTTDLDSQRAALAQIVRLAKAQAIPILQRVNTAQPALQKDVQDYLQILQEGAVEIAVIDRRKLELEAAAGGSGSAR